MNWPNPFKRKSIWQGVDMMQLVPQQVRLVEEGEEKGKLAVLVPRYETWPYNKLIQPFLKPDKRHLRIPLDARGSYLWSQMDGQMNIGQMVAGFETNFPEDRDDAPKRLGQFFFGLHQNGFIKFTNLDE